MRGAVGMPMRQPGDFLRDAGAIGRAWRVQPRNLGDAAVKAKRVANTEAAVARGGFGAATCVVGDALFFGQDRLDFVREALTAA